MQYAPNLCLPWEQLTVSASDIVSGTQYAVVTGPTELKVVELNVMIFYYCIDSKIHFKVETNHPHNCWRVWRFYWLYVCYVILVNKEADESFWEAHEELHGQQALETGEASCDNINWRSQHGSVRRSKAIVYILNTVYVRTISLFCHIAYKTTEYICNL